MDKVIFQMLLHQHLDYPGLPSVITGMLLTRGGQGYMSQRRGLTMGVDIDMMYLLLEKPVCRSGSNR